MMKLLRRMVAVGFALLLTASPARAQPATTSATAPSTKPATTRAVAVADFRPITLRARAIGPEEAFGKVSAETGAIFVTDSGTLFNDGQSPAAMLVDVRGQSFWVAMDNICRAARVGVRGLGSGDEQIAIFQRNENQPIWGQRPSYPSGPALFIPEAVTRTDQRDFFRAKSATPTATVSVDVWTDPRLKAITIAGPAKLAEAVDEAGVVLARDPNDVEQAGGANGARWMYRMNVRLQLPPNVGKRIARLRGEVTFVTVMKTETIEMKLADAKGKTHSVLGFPIEFKGVTLGNAYAAIDVGTVRGKSEPAEWGRFLTLFEQIVSQMQVLDETDVPMRAEGWGSSSSDQFVSRNITYRDINEKAKPTKIMWVVPTELGEVTVPFEVKDLVLP